MAESTRVSEQEIERREKYLRAGLREFDLKDPFTWPYPWKEHCSLLVYLRSSCNHQSSSVISLIISKSSLWILEHLDEELTDFQVVIFDNQGVLPLYKGAGVMLGTSLLSAHMYNVWNKRPYYYAIFPRMIAIAFVTAVGYGLGSLREHHYKTRDAVIQHYIELHPKDFDHFNDRCGRAFSQILLPWYPRRTQYTKH